MTDYTKNASFTAKTGQTIEGADFDSEFDEIATAIASKENVASKGAANGYCGLDSGGLVLDSDLSANVALKDGNNTFTGTNTLAATTPTSWIEDAGAAANSGKWRVRVSSGIFYLSAMDDAESSGNNLLQVARTGTTIGTVTLGGTVLSFAGTISGCTEMSALTGSFAAMNTTGAVSVGTTLGVTGAATFSSTLTVGGASVLTTATAVTEAQITDSTILARVGSNETVTGSWNFSAVPKYTSAGAFPHYASATQSSGAITVSVSDASGTPGDGDLWIKYTA